jgi:CDP-6-deoxy-D-xylo-4-hexulose-3-dehydrase
MTDLNFRQQIIDENPDLNPDFIFLNPAHNFRSTELNAVIGLSQIKKLDANNVNRVDNFNYFISKLYFAGERHMFYYNVTLNSA